MTIYNGLPANCNLSSVQLEFVKNDTTDIQNFDFIMGDAKFAELNVPDDGMFTLKEFTVGCGADIKSITFEESSFYPLAPGKDEVPNMHVMLTYDLNDITTGILKAGENIDPLDKSKKGMPEFKFIWNTYSEIPRFQVMNSDGEVENELFFNSTIGDSEKIEAESLGKHTIIYTDGSSSKVIGEVDFLFGANYQLLYIEKEEVRNLQF